MNNLWYVFSTSDEVSRKIGLSAYDNYREQIAHVSARYGFSSDVGCGVFAAISPNNDERGGLVGMRGLMAGYRMGIPLSKISVTTYPLNRRKAWEILSGRDPLDVLRGPKVVSFYEALTGNLDAVVVDGHMWAAWCGERLTLKESELNEKRYRTIAHAVRRLAEYAHVTPAHFQAVVWFSWRFRHRIQRAWVDRNNQAWLGF